MQFSASDVGWFENKSPETDPTNKQFIEQLHIMTIQSDNQLIEKLASICSQRGSI